MYIGTQRTKQLHIINIHTYTMQLSKLAGSERTGAEGCKGTRASCWRMATDFGDQVAEGRRVGFSAGRRPGTGDAAVGEEARLRRGRRREAFGDERDEE